MAKSKHPVAVLQLQARTYSPGALLGNFLSDNASAEIQTLQARVPRGWGCGVPALNSLSGVREWMDTHELVLVDVKLKYNPAPGAWKGLYVLKIGRQGDFGLNPYEMMLNERPEDTETAYLL